MSRLNSTLITSVVFCLCAGCQQTAEEAMEGAIESKIAGEGGSADVEFDGKSMSMKIMGKDGDAQLHVGPGAKMPNDFPKDIPIYPGMTVMMSHSQAEGKMFFVQANSSEPVSRMADFFKKEVPAQGWQAKTETAMQAEGTKSLGYEKDGRMLQITLSTSDKEGSSISIATGTE